MWKTNSQNKSSTERKKPTQNEKEKRKWNGREDEIDREKAQGEGEEKAEESGIHWNGENQASGFVH